MGFKSGYTDFPSNAMLIKPNGKIETINIYFRDHDIRRADIETIRKIAEDKYAVAVLLVDDRRTISFDEMAKFFSLDDVSPSGMQYYRSTLLHQLIGGTIANLPRGLWRNDLIIASKGPMVEKKAIVLPYTEGPDDSVVWLGEELSDWAKVNILPNWWKA